jgi:flavin-dependent thymidylate synthase
MFAAAPLVRDGEEVEPVVTVLEMTRKPLQVGAAVNQIYKGDPVHSPDDVPKSMALAFLEDMKKTTLQAPLEWIHIALFIEGVSRAFTHQLVRQRTAAFAQESLRFAVKENAAMEVVIPPAFAILPADDETRREWDDHMARTGWLYNRWIDKGIPAEDARGGLLINTATRIHYDTNLRNLAEHSGYRLCSQAQYEWKIVWAKIIQAITAYGPEEDRWQQRAITTLFKPICFQTGKCEFMGSADRYCDIRDRVEAHHAAGDPPDTWTNIGVWEPLGYAAARKQ